GAELVTVSSPERPSGGGQDERLDRGRVATLEALVRRRVLAVDRQEPPLPVRPRLQRELPRRDEAFLVGEGEIDAALESPDGRRQAGKTDDRVQDEVRFGLVQ